MNCGVAHLILVKFSDTISCTMGRSGRDMELLSFQLDRNEMATLVSEPREVVVGFVG